MEIGRVNFSPTWCPQTLAAADRVLSGPETTWPARLISGISRTRLKVTSRRLLLLQEQLAEHRLRVVGSSGASRLFLARKRPKTQFFTIYCTKSDIHFSHAQPDPVAQNSPTAARFRPN